MLCGIEESPSQALFEYLTHKIVRKNKNIFKFKLLCCGGWGECFTAVDKRTRSLSTSGSWFPHQQNVRFESDL